LAQGVDDGVQTAPRASVVDGAVDEAWVVVDVEVGTEEVAEDERGPEQKPDTHVLNAHCELEVHTAWKFPQ
jgi:hypothetical protein